MQCVKLESYGSECQLMNLYYDDQINHWWIFKVEREQVGTNIGFPTGMTIFEQKHLATEKVRNKRNKL